MDGRPAVVAEHLAVGDGLRALAAVRLTTGRAVAGVGPLRAAMRGLGLAISAMSMGRWVVDVQAVLADEPAGHGGRAAALVFVGGAREGDELADPVDDRTHSLRR